MKRRLVRCVPLLAYSSSSKPTFLYTSERPNRCNPSGVNCLYFSETLQTAETEYFQYWRGLKAEHQPRLTFSARVSLRKIIDLSQAQTRKYLGLTFNDFTANWRLVSEPTRLQNIGRAISSQQEISALRYPSAAVKKRGKAGWNIVIFTEALRSPDRVEILGDSEDPLEVIP